MVKPMAAQPSRIASLTEAVIAWLGAALSRDRLLAEFNLRMVGICPAKVLGAGLDHAQGRGIGRKPGVDGEAVVVVRIVGRRIGREAARGPVLEALIDRQDHQLAGAAEPALHEDAGEIGLGLGRVAFISVEDFLDRFAERHGVSLGSSPI